MGHLHAGYDNRISGEVTVAVRTEPNSRKIMAAVEANHCLVKGVVTYGQIVGLLILPHSDTRHVSYLYAGVTCFLSEFGG